MNELIKVNYDTERHTVLGRDLHKVLGVRSKYADWFKNISVYGFVENTDFMTLSKNLENGGRTLDHQLTVDMAKEVAMLQRNDRGKQVRQYFLQLEKQWNSPEYLMARALKMADERVKGLEIENKAQRQIIGELKPKADYVDWILKNPGLVTITQIAKDYGMSGTRMNGVLHNLGIQYRQGRQWLLYRKYHSMGYTHSETVEIVRSDGRPDIEMYTKWTQKGRLFIYELLKDEGILPVIEAV